MITKDHLLTGDEQLRPIVDVAAEVGVQISSRTALRWALAGLRGVRLASVKVGGKRLTTFSALRRFLLAIQDRPRLPQDVSEPMDADAVLKGYGLDRDPASSPEQAGPSD